MCRRLFVVTNRKLIKKGNIYSMVKACVEGGADAVILREKDLNLEELYSTAVKLKEIIDNRIPLIVNNNYNVAVKCNSEGIQLSYHSFINFNKNYDKITGVSVHCLEEAIKADNMGADYILTGHIFDTSCKAGLPGRGIEFLREICKNVSLPAIAIGGIDEYNIINVLKAGAGGVAVMSSVMEADSPGDEVYKMKSIINNFNLNL